MSADMQNNNKLTINNIHKIEGKVLLITTPLATNLITGGRGLTTRCEIYSAHMWEDVYTFRLNDTPDEYINLYRHLSAKGNTRQLSLCKDGKIYATIMNADFLKTPDLFIAGLENTTWDYLPF
jgi:hypothetical protein